MCSLSQQLALSSFLNPRITASTRHTLFYPWITTFARVVYLSAPCHLTTVLFCLLNLFIFPSSTSPFTADKTLWASALVLTLLHGYPWKVGLRLSRIRENDWRRMDSEEGKKLIALFTEVNATRLAKVDVWGWVAVLGAASVRFAT